MKPVREKFPHEGGLAFRADSAWRFADTLFHFVSSFGHGFAILNKLYL